MDIFGDIKSEVEFFFSGLNWTYILIYVFILYGIRHKEEFMWYNNFMDKNLNIKPFKVWIAGIIVMLIFILFNHLENGVTPSYISQMLRSWIIVIIFNSIFTNKIKNIDK